MPVITALKKQRRDNRVNVYVDGVFSFGIDLEQYVGFGLKTGQELSSERLEEISGKAELQKLFSKAYAYALARPRSEKEIRDWFARKKIDDKYRTSLLEKLTKYELLDDTKFAHWWVEQRTIFRSKSKREIRSELRQKGIARDIISEVTSDLSDRVAIQKLLKKNESKWGGLEDSERKKKMSDYLARKGFSWDEVRSIVGKQEE